MGGAAGKGWAVSPVLMVGDVGGGGGGAASLPVVAMAYWRQLRRQGWLVALAGSTLKRWDGLVDTMDNKRGRRWQSRRPSREIRQPCRQQL